MLFELMNAVANTYNRLPLAPEKLLYAAGLGLVAMGVFNKEFGNWVVGGGQVTLGGLAMFAASSGESPQ
jgi:hypothetical protein